MNTDYQFLPVLVLMAGLLVLVACGGGTNPSNSSRAALNEQSPPSQPIIVYTVDGEPENVLQQARNRLDPSKRPGKVQIRNAPMDELLLHCNAETDLLFPGRNLDGSERKRCEKNQFTPLEFVLGHHLESEGQVRLYANESSLKRTRVRSYLTSVLKVTSGDSVTRFGYQPVSEDTYVRNRGQIRFYQ